MRHATSRGTVLALLALAAAAAPAAAAITVNGALDPDYGPARVTQSTQTQFGNSSTGTVDNANGSELDAAYGVIRGGKLHLFLAGNLESNFNKLEIFLDAVPGGQNQLRGDNPNVDFNGLNRMGNDGSGNGLKFDAGFAPDYWIGLGGGGGPYQLFANFAELLTSGGGTGNYLGQTGAGSSGTLTGGTNPAGIKATIDNSNTAGVDGGCGPASGAGVTRGIELEIPLSAIGGKNAVQVCVMVNGSGHDFVSNQVLGPLPVGTCNLGEPRSVDLSAIGGTQYFTVIGDAVPAGTPWSLALLSLGLGAAAVLVLRRRMAGAA